MMPIFSLVICTEARQSCAAPEAWQSRALAWRASQQTHGAGLLEVTFPPFIDPAGMFGFLLLTLPERVGFLDGEKAFQ